MFTPTQSPLPVFTNLYLQTIRRTRLVIWPWSTFVRNCMSSVSLSIIYCHLRGTLDMIWETEGIVIWVDSSKWLVLVSLFVLYLIICNMWLLFPVCVMTSYWLIVCCYLLTVWFLCCFLVLHCCKHMCLSCALNHLLTYLLYILYTAVNWIENCCQTDDLNHLKNNKL